jgi:hypothetical protein
MVLRIGAKKEEISREFEDFTATERKGRWMFLMNGERLR